MRPGFQPSACQVVRCQSIITRSRSERRDAINRTTFGAVACRIETLQFANVLIHKCTRNTPGVLLTLDP
jgi:hypothetical protein